MLFLTSLVLLYHTDTSIALRDRLYYLGQVLLHSTPFMLLCSYLLSWRQAHQAFVNILIGAAYHLRYHSFSLRALLLKNAQMLSVIAAVYILLALLEVPLSQTTTGEVFENTLQLMTLLYPVSKAIKNIFVLTHGKYPPAWVIKALYNYEREGKLKEFFNND